MRTRVFKPKLFLLFFITKYSLYENGEVGSEPGYTSTPKRHHGGGGGSGGFFSPPFFLSSSAAAVTSAAMTAAEFREYYASAAAAAGYPLCSSANNSGSSGGSGGGGGSGTMPSQSHHGTPHTTGGAGHVNHESSTPSGTGPSNGLHMLPKGPEDEWKNIHVMLNCILSMVEKTKRALSILQNRTFQQQQEQAAAVAAAGDSGANSSSWLRRPPVFTSLETNEELKRQTSEMIAQALRATEDRVSEVKRRAGEKTRKVPSRH